MSEEKKVLIIEDEKFVIEALTDKFEASNFLVFKAEDGVMGLEMAEKNIPDIIILDVVMPKMDGLEMLKRLRESDWGKNIPVILLTNISDGAKIQEAEKLGISKYMLKAEWKLKEIIVEVEKILKKD
jgi:CheY-like chemotaxis protein